MTARTITEFVKATLPQPLIDALRLLARAGSSERRQNAVRRQADADQDRAFVQTISPDNTVLSGPFAGLHFATSHTWLSLAPCIVGSYEDELHPALEALIAAKPEWVVDVGAADGYYAVGLAMRLPHARVEAFEIDDYSRHSCARVAAANNVHGRVNIRRAATLRKLSSALRPGALLVMDCEGGESHLLDPDRLPVLRSCSILVELHDFDGTGLPARVLQRFEHSHQTEIIESRCKHGSAYATLLAHLSPAQRDRAVDEHRLRGAVVWAVMSPLEGSKLIREAHMACR